MDFLRRSAWTREVGSGEGRRQGLRGLQGLKREVEGWGWHTGLPGSGREDSLMQSLTASVSHPPFSISSLGLVSAFLSLLLPTHCPTPAFPCGQQCPSVPALSYPCSSFLLLLFLPLLLCPSSCLSSLWAFPHLPLGAKGLCRRARGETKGMRFKEDPQRRGPQSLPQSEPLWRQTFSERNLRTLDPGWGLSLSLAWTLTLTMGVGAAWAALWNAGVGLQGDASSDNGQELDFLVWLLPPRPLECEGGGTVKRPWGLGVNR